MTNTSQTFDGGNVGAVPDLYDANLTTAEEGMVHDLFAVLIANLPMNLERSRYYRGEIGMSDLGYALDPRLKGRAGSAVNWAAKSVDMLAQRSTLDGFAWADGNDRLADVFAENNMKTLYSQANVSQLTHCFATWTVTPGDDGDMSPVIINAHSALNSSVLWDMGRHRVRAGLALIDVDRDGEPCAWNVYLRDKTLELTRNGVRWECESKPHTVGRPLMEVMPYDPPLDRPLGRPRINKAVRDCMDKAKVTNALISVYSELFTIPQRYLFGTDPDDPVFTGGWDSLMGHVIEISDDGTGSNPTYGQLAQVSPQPLLEVYQHWAKEMSDETHIPLNALGVVQDNPSSAEAMYAANEPLIMDAKRMNDRNGAALANVARMALAIENDTSVSKLKPEDRNVTVIWGDAEHLSDSSRADSTVKEASVFAQYAAAGKEVPDVVLERMGYDEGERIRFRAQERRGQTSSAIDAIAAAVSGARDLVRREGE
jgi:hypothetical protein